ncbi:M56 family metallopeptidase [Bacillus sp. S/N-304-OC-R1]|uniref:M56 family metallopeptidase n=1 Tax=Bacillus sp. S/N-304-OC-R1 TaxID=2758034 RepID=UPI0028BE2F66|nr:M56 family metallopeptidase [Bacillus sp. S/N-304-OC-R1]
MYWFNPLIWYSLNQIKQDCEVACDSSVISTLKTEEVKKYVVTIINMIRLLAEKRSTTGTLGYASKYNKRGIIMITQFNKSSASSISSISNALSSKGYTQRKLLSRIMQLAKQGKIINS